MDLVRKVEIAVASVKSIAEHDDAPEKIVEAALGEVTRMINALAIEMNIRRARKRQDALDRERERSELGSSTDPSRLPSGEVVEAKEEK